MYFEIESGEKLARNTRFTPGNPHPRLRDRVKQPLGDDLLVLAQRLGAHIAVPDPEPAPARVPRFTRALDLIDGSERGHGDNVICV